MSNVHRTRVLNPLLVTLVLGSGTLPWYRTDRQLRKRAVFATNTDYLRFLGFPRCCEKAQLS